MNKKTSYLVFGLMITSCSSQDRRLLMSGGEKVHGPNGYGDYIVSCYDISRCYSKAAYECDGAYDVVHVTDGISDGGTVVHNMLISCESPSIYQKDTYWSR